MHTFKYPYNKPNTGLCLFDRSSGQTQKDSETLRSTDTERKDWDETEVFGRNLSLFGEH